MNSHEQFMQRALDLAALGKERVAPNPMVGAVIVHNGLIIGEGYHEQFGEAHAEVNAVRAVENKDMLSEATMYVTLEPCAHHGKTPPCADLIVHHRFKKVFIAMQDPFSEVAGKGIQRLKNAGIEVEVGMMEAEARELNKRFLTFHTLKRPYYILKWAQSANGFMDIDRQTGTKGIHWITQPETRLLTHQWRAEEMAILTGVTTILNDNPSLTTRDYPGKSPLRIILDPNHKLSGTEAIFQDEHTTWHLVREENQHHLAQTHVLDPFTLENINRFLYERGISSVLVEGGKQTLETFLAQNCWDEARILTGQQTISNGMKAPGIPGKLSQSFSFGKDHIQIFKRV